MSRSKKFVKWHKECINAQIRNNLGHGHHLTSKKQKERKQLKARLLDFSVNINRSQHQDLNRQIPKSESLTVKKQQLDKLLKLKNQREEEKLNNTPYEDAMKEKQMNPVSWRSAVNFKKVLNNYDHKLGQANPESIK